MNPIYKAALRASKLQRIILIDYRNKKQVQKQIAEQFIKAFPMGFFIYDQLFVAHQKDVSIWLESLSPENTKIFLESEHFDFLN